MESMRMAGLALAVRAMATICLGEHIIYKHIIYIVPVLIMQELSGLSVIICMYYQVCSLHCLHSGAPLSC